MIRRHTVVTVVVLLLTWAVAGVANAGGFIMGDTPSAFEIVATLVAIVAWPTAGWFSGRRFESGIIRLATVVWIVVVAGTPVTVWILRWALAAEVLFEGFGKLLTVFYYAYIVALAAPFYGLSAALPSLDAIVGTSLYGAALFAMTLIAYNAGRRSGRPAAQASTEELGECCSSAEAGHSTVRVYGSNR